MEDKSNMLHVASSAQPNECFNAQTWRHNVFSSDSQTSDKAQTCPGYLSDVGWLPAVLTFTCLPSCCDYILDISNFVLKSPLPDVPTAPSLSWHFTGSNMIPKVSSRLVFTFHREGFVVTHSLSAQLNFLNPWHFQVAFSNHRNPSKGLYRWRVAHEARLWLEYEVMKCLPVGANIVSSIQSSASQS